MYSIMTELEKKYEVAFQEMYEYGLTCYHGHYGSLEEKRHYRKLGKVVDHIQAELYNAKYYFVSWSDEVDNIPGRTYEIAKSPKVFCGGVCEQNYKEPLVNCCVCNLEFRKKRNRVRVKNYCEDCTGHRKRKMKWIDEKCPVCNKEVKKWVQADDKSRLHFCCNSHTKEYYQGGGVRNVDEG